MALCVCRSGPKANKLRRERRAQPGHAHQRRVRRGGVGRTATATATAHMLCLNAALVIIAQCDHDPL